MDRRVILAPVQHTHIRDSHEPGRFRLTCDRCGIRADDLTYAEVCRRQDQHDAMHATAEIGLPQ